MRMRSYRFFEVRTNLGRDDEELQYRGGYERCLTVLDRYAAPADKNQGNVYLVQVQLLEARKADKR